MAEDFSVSSSRDVYIKAKGMPCRVGCTVCEVVWFINISTAVDKEFLDGLLDHLAGFAGALLDVADDFIRSTFGKLEVVIRELGPFLFELALGDVPIAFDFKCCHDCVFAVMFSGGSPTFIGAIEPQ